MRDKILKAFKNSVNKQHGKTMGLAANMQPLDMPRLSTGVLSFDMAMGGGIPVGRLTIFRGQESSGKTTAALRAAGLAQNLCANCLRLAKDLEVVEGVDEETGEVEYVAKATCDCYQKGIFKPVPYPEEFSDRAKGTMKQCDAVTVDPKTGKEKKGKSTFFKERIRRYEENSYEEFRVAFFDFEGSLDVGWCEALGLDTRRLLLVVPSTAEEGIDIYDELMRTGAIDLFVLDSVAAMTPSIEVEASTEDEQRAAAAKLVNKFVRKVTSAVNDCKRDYGRLPSQVWINQERDAMSASRFGPTKTMPAGMGQKFGASVIVSMWASGWEKDSLDKDLKKEFQLEIGKEVRMNFKVVKNKTAPSQASGGYVMRVAGSRKGCVEELKYILDQSRKYSLFREDGEGTKKKWFVGDEEFDRKGDALARIEEPAVLASLKTALLKRMLGNEELEN